MHRLVPFAAPALDRRTQALRAYLLLAAAALAAALAPTSRAQDPRTVTEPTFPATCTALSASQAVAGLGDSSGPLVNFSGEPASETAFDTARVQAALNACPAGQAVELTTDATGANNAFLIQPIDIPTGVTLLVDAGVTVFGSRNPADYQSTLPLPPPGEETCGTLGSKGNGCRPLIAVNADAASTGAGLMGYGVINGRGGDPLLVNGTPTATTWWTLSDSAAATPGAVPNIPDLLHARQAAHFTLYKITLINAPLAHAKLQNSSAFTAWDVKIVTPFTARSADGIDLDDGTNAATIANSFLSTGGDMIALAAAPGTQVSDVSVLNVDTLGGRGVSLGPGIGGGIANVLVANLNQTGDSADSNSGGLRIAAAADTGGLVQNINYQNICQSGIRNAIQFNSFADSNAGAPDASFQRVAIHNLTSLSAGSAQFQGSNANFPLGLTLDNVSFPNGVSLTAAPRYATITYGPAPVNPAALTAISGPGVAYINAVSTPGAAPYACTATTAPRLAGELFLSTSPHTANAAPGATNRQSLTIAPGSSFTLNATLEDLNALDAVPSAQVNFFDGATPIGSGTPTGNGTLVQYTVTNATPGTHLYTARYAGDTAHPSFTFGSVTAALTNPAATTTTLTAPAAANYGASVTLAATVVTSTGAPVPTGSVAFLNGAATLATVTVINGSASFTTSALPPATYKITAAFAPSAAYGGSSSAASTLVISPDPQTITLSGLPAAVTYGASPLTITATASSGLPVTLTVSGPATLSGATLTCNGAGNVILSANQAGNLTYAAAPTVTAAVFVNPAPLTVTPANVSIPYLSAIPALTGTIAGLVNGDLISASYTTTATATSAPGVYPITATLSDPNARATNYTVTLNTGAVTVTPATTSVTLSSISAGTYAGETLQLVATVGSQTGVPATGTVLLMNGASVLATATVVNGLATFHLSAIAAGSYTLTASFIASASYTGATSPGLNITIVPPVTVSLSPSTLPLAAGATGSSALAITPAGGFAGAALIQCTSPAAYITCSAASAVAVSGSAAASVPVTVTVHGSVSVNTAAPRSGPRPTYLAGLATLALLATLPLPGRRRALRLLSLALVSLIATLALAGCGGPAANNPAVNLPPAGNQPLTLTVTASGNTVTTTLTVNVTN